MKPLREWIEEHRDDYSIPTPEVTFDHESGIHMGWSLAMDRVLKELKAREDAERERVNENVKALDSLAGEILDEKEGGSR